MMNKKQRLRALIERAKQHRTQINQMLRDLDLIQFEIKKAYREWKAISPKSTSPPGGNSNPLPEHHQSQPPHPAVGPTHQPSQGK